MTPPVLALLWLASMLPIACDNRGAKVEATPEIPTGPGSGTPPSHDPRKSDPPPTRPGNTPAAADTGAATPAAANASAGAGREGGVGESADELARFAKLPVRPTSVVWQSGVSGKNEHPDIPGPTDFFSSRSSATLPPSR